MSAAGNHEAVYEDEGSRGGGAVPQARPAASSRARPRCRAVDSGASAGAASRFATAAARVPASAVAPACCNVLAVTGSSTGWSLPPLFWRCIFRAGCLQSDAHSCCPQPASVPAPHCALQTLAAVPVLQYSGEETHCRPTVQCSYCSTVQYSAIHTHCRHTVPQSGIQGPLLGDCSVVP